VEWILARGYRVEHLAATDGSVCLIHDGDERWGAWGETAETALANTLRLMFPSRASREAIERAAGASSSSSTEIVDSVEASESPPPREELAPALVEARVEARHESSGEAEPDPAPSEDEVLEAPLPDRVEGKQPELVEGGVEETHEPSAEPDTVLDEDDVLEELAALTDRVDAARPELAFMAPELQRLHMTAWMSRARSLERALPGHEGVQLAVRAVARSLTDVAKLWWPGSVIALQLQATPEQVRAALDLDGAGELHTWAEVALAAEEHAASVGARPRGADRRSGAGGGRGYAW